jgi:hypothetical protein
MKKRTLKLAVYGLMMTAMLFNCKDKDDKDPETPSGPILQDLEKINLAPITIDAPAAVKSTEASIEASAKATELDDAINGIEASGTVPASVVSAAGDVTGAISQSEINTLNSVSSETIAAVAAGGTLTPELKAILDKAMANSALAAYLPKFTLPTVNDVTITARIGGTEAVDKVDGIQISDACLAAANTAFDVVKTRLDASKVTETAKVDAAYATWIAPIAAGQTACTDGLTPKYAALRTEAQQAYAESVASLDARQGILGNMYPVFKASVSLILVVKLNGINILEGADKKACIAKAEGAKNLADAAKTANTAKVDAAYTTSLAEANRLKAAAIESCHNQGGGN